jgi:hypothetical protein
MGLRKNGRANTLPYFGTSTVEKSFFGKFTTAPRAHYKIWKYSKFSAFRFFRQVESV